MHGKRTCYNDKALSIASRERERLCLVECKNLELKSFFIYGGLMRSLLLALILIVASVPLAAQDWTARYNATGSNMDQATDVASVNGNTYVTGSTYSSAGNWDIVVQKIDAGGNTLWSKIIGSATDDEKPSSISLDNSGNAYVAAAIWDASLMQWVTGVWQVMDDGSDGWNTAQVTGPDHNNSALDAVMLSNGNLAVLSFGIDGTGGTFAHIRVLNISDGSTVWQSSNYGPDDVQFFAQTISAGTSGLVVAGSALLLSNAAQPALLVYANDGSEIASPVFIAANGGHFISASINDAGSISAGGWTMTGTGGNTMLVVNYNASAVQQWSYTLPGVGSTGSKTAALELDNQGNTVGTVREVVTGQGLNITTFMLDPAGALTWSDSYAGPGTAADNTAPLYQGATSGFVVPGFGGVLTWFPAIDDVSTSDEILYQIFRSTTQGGQNFSSPDMETTANVFAVITDLLPGVTEYVVVRAVDAAGNSDMNTKEIVLSPAGSALAIVTTTLADGAVGTEYSGLLDATGGTTPYSWELASGTLPDGLQLQSDGSITGTPTAAGKSDFRVRVTDANTSTDERDLSITISAAPLTITTASVPNAFLGTQYSEMLEAEGGVPPYSWTLDSGTLPDGITLGTDGVLSGTSNVISSTQFTAMVTDNAAASATKSYSISVIPSSALIVSSDMSLPGGKYWYSSVIVMAGATLTFTGPATICVTDTIQIDGTVIADCHGLIFNEFNYINITGVIDNRCTSGGTGENLVILSHDAEYNLEGGPGSGIFTDGDFTMGDDTTYADWEMVISPEIKSTTPEDPVGSVYADVLHTPALIDDPAVVGFKLSGADPDGGAVMFDIDFGDGDMRSDIATDDGSVAYIEKEYATPGSYDITLTIKDDDGKSTHATAHVFISDSASIGSEDLGLAAETDLVIAVNDTLYFDGFVETGGDAIHSSSLWDFGDAAQADSLNPYHVYTSTGTKNVSLMVEDDSGNTATATLSVFVYSPDTSAFSGGGGSQAAPAAPPAVVNVPINLPRGGRVVFRNPNVVFNPAANINATPAPNAVAGRKGRGGGRLNVFFRGNIVLNGNNINAANGANGGGNAPGGGSAGKGGNGGSLKIYGKNVTINGGTFAAGDGGEGGSATKVTAATKTAFARGKQGGNAGSSVSIRASKCVTFTAPTTIHVGDGGDGGEGTATGGAGKDQCKTGQRGSHAIAYGGKGGKANKRGILRGCVIGAAFISVTGGIAGDGGDATSTGGGGGNALGCLGFAQGGEGGKAIAKAGNGGKGGYRGPRFPGTGLFFAGDGGTATANAGSGGAASATPDPPVGGAGCPGEKGGDATAIGGKGGNATSTNGRKGELSGRGIPGTPGASIANGSNGGSATSTGGEGGPGTGCNCDGGPGGDATSTGGIHGNTTARSRGGGAATKNEGDDGNANATGGVGGTGGSCCTPPGSKGGDGGKGGSATATCGLKGSTAIATGGNGGNGGPGWGPGSGGGGGPASAIAANPTQTPGNPGGPGAPCPPMTWYIPFDLIPDGAITPGAVTLPVYSEKMIDPAYLVGEVEVFMGENLFKNPPGIAMGPGTFIGVDWTKLQTPTGADFSTMKITKNVATIINVTTFPQCFVIIGREGGSTSQAECQNPGGPASQEDVEINTSPTMTSFEQTDMQATADIILTPWGLCFTVSYR
jgi:putative Ig domain-containing protein/PKD domain-containing protein